MKYEKLISQLTLEEKCSLLSGKNFWETRDIKRLGIPSLYMSDGPTGLRKQQASSDQLGLNPSYPATCVPTASCLACSWNPSLTEKAGLIIGREAKLLGTGMLLAPGVNIVRNPKGGRSFEYFSEDPYLTGKLAAGYIKGVQSNGVSATIKHFACNSQETRRINSNSIVDERALREIYLTNFEIAIKEANPHALMSSYNMLNGTYTNENRHLMVDILRNEWNYKGIVVTDWGGENDRVEGAKCFNELEMPSNNGDTDRTLVEAVKNGLIDETIIDQNVDNLLDLVFSSYETTKDSKTPVKKEGKTEISGINLFPDVKKNHHKLAAEIARETMVLLKNDNDVLPLKTTDKVAFIGDFIENFRYQGAGSSQVIPTTVDNFIDILNSKDHPFSYLGYEKGYKRYGGKSKKLINKAKTLCEKAEKIVLFFGLDELTESEGLDRETLSLPLNQLALFEELSSLGKSIIVVLLSGSTVELNFADKCSGILSANLSGQAGTHALYETLVGLVNPSGKLANTIPFYYEDLSSSNYFPSSDIDAPYKESIYVGYRYFVNISNKPRYPFGYGLSYTKFKYSDLEVTDQAISFKITNIGKVPGKEIAQLYIGKKDSALYRPLYELKSFVKTNLLKPNETVKVSMAFDEYSFRVFDTKRNSFVVEDGEYELYVGSSSEDILLTGSINKKGVKITPELGKTQIPSYYNFNLKDIDDFEFNLLTPKAKHHSIVFLNKRKTRIHLTMTNCFCDLVYAKGFVGRLIGKFLNFGLWCGKVFNNKHLTQFIKFGPYYLPIRALSRMAGLSMKQAEGLLEVFNGHFFKGLHHFRIAKKDKPKIKKEDL